MKLPLKPVLVSLALFLALGGVLALFAFMYLADLRPADAIDSIRDKGIQALYRFRIVENLSAAETTRLYQQSCTRRCHGRDVIEKSPRTAADFWTSARGSR